jgi:hypothetical protein
LHSDLSSATVRRNKEVENRVAELEVELLVWKQAHSVAIEASEREVKAHNVQIAALNRQISNTDFFKSVRVPFTLLPFYRLIGESFRTNTPSFYVLSMATSSFLTASSCSKGIKEVELLRNN